MTWTTVHSAHAIERIGFAVTFKEQLPTKVVDKAWKSFEPRSGELRFDSRQEQSLNEFTIVGDSHTVKKTPGWTSHRGVHGGQTIEALSLDGRTLSYESSDYRGWTKAKKRLQTVLGGIVEDLAVVVDVQSVDLNYTDRFVFNGLPSEADTSPLLSDQVLKLIDEGAMKSRKLWHLHRGWFKELHGQDFLVNQNIDVQEGATPAGIVVRSLQILNKVELRPSQDYDAGGLEELLEVLHSEGLEVFAECLSVLGQKMVNLYSPGRSQ